MAFGKRGLACQPAIIGIGLGGSKDICMTLGKRASTLRVVGSRNSDPQIAEMEDEFKELGNSIGMEKVAVHLHDTLAMGLANSATAISAGVRVVDSSVGGLGGCPFAPGSRGTLATEALLLMATKMGFETGVDIEKIYEAVEIAEQALERPIGGRSRSWWEQKRSEQKRSAK